MKKSLYALAIAAVVGLSGCIETKLEFNYYEKVMDVEKTTIYPLNFYRNIFWMKTDDMGEVIRYSFDIGIFSSECCWLSDYNLDGRVDEINSCPGTKTPFPIGKYDGKFLEANLKFRELKSELNQSMDLDEITQNWDNYRLKLDKN